MISQAINNLAPGAEWTLAGSSIEWSGNKPTNLIWHSKDIPIPSKSDIEAEATRLQEKYDSTEYQRKRAAEYPPMTDYLDAVVKNDAEQMQAYIDACLAVKAKYPKPE